ncbi:pyridoxal phosphate-dependent aminotransferase [Gloeocapsa sp. PCC 73106]|uniref:pyridoxal phosphate-dependent aminotransferase n=1 Tax=Gloeocapsa sp. PCC 73106 TaxID=102232 RepID=UPI0002AC918D|nr:pyridoxal phosphate-dependent aminotransferase [Gloeocapsa sp. PCC 73106]ELR97993.1 aspartate/tyrosine/aromatic aminotransferase [Gloeocapsa sp. PCC 73106]
MRLTNHSRMDAVQAPVIPLVGDLIRQNPGTISLGQGVVFYPPPQEAIASISAFLSEAENHKYQAVGGIALLKEAIIEKLSRDNRMEIEGDHTVVVTAGSNMGFINALLAITNPGSEIILPTPYYFNHEMAITMASCTPVLVPTDSDYQLQPEAIKAAITPKTKAVVTISPNNPTGVIYRELDLREVNEICREQGLYHISDEAYEYFTYEGAQHVSPGSFPGSAGHTISLYSLSKAYGFASWRIGYLVIPQHLLEAVRKIQDTILICPPVISQYAAIGALKVGKSYCLQYLQEITVVRQFLLDSLGAIASIVKIVPSQGAFYFFLKVNRPVSDWELVKKLVKEYQIAVIPGTTFGMTEGCYLRIAYGALLPATALTGIERLVTGLKAILL